MKGTIKKCPACGASFTCQGEDDCWCESYQLHKKDFLAITEKYTDCLCPACLSKYAEK